MRSQTAIISAHIHAMHIIDDTVRRVLRKKYKGRMKEGAHDLIEFPSKTIAKAYKGDYIELTKLHLADYADKYPERVK